MRCLVVLLVAYGCNSPQRNPSEPTRAEAAPAAAGPAPSPRAIALAGGGSGIGFDDLRFAPGLGKIVAPAGATGTIALVDPDTGAVVTIGGFAAGGTHGGHDDGPTSADEGNGFLFATDRTAGKLDVIDEKTQRIVASAPLAGSPDYVRWIDNTHEVWVTEPDSESIEVFSLVASVPKHVGAIAIQGGPESLVIDPTRKRAFTHLWDGATLAIDLGSRKVVSRWKNGCQGSRGIALDSQRGLLFTGCAEGAVTTLEIEHGKLVGMAKIGPGIDVIGYSPKLRHLYAVSAKTGELAIIGVEGAGGLRVLGTVPTAEGAHCVVSDDHAGVWVCDVRGGRLLAFPDTYH